MAFRSGFFSMLVFGLTVLLIPTHLVGQDPGLPHESGETEERTEANSFGRGTVIRGIHNESVGAPNLDAIRNPDGPHVNQIWPKPIIPRYYITCYYYGCRPWFIHPYTGKTLSATDIMASVQFSNPDFQEFLTLPDGKPIQFNEVHPLLGEPLICVEDGGMQDENNEGAQQESELEQDCESQNEATALAAVQEFHGLTLAPQVPKIDDYRLPIWHRPWYGLYCLRVRICIPIVNADANHIRTQRWRFHCRFRYPGHQPICWRRFWWSRYCTTSLYGPRICPWRPWCAPHFSWSRSGPDWVWNCYNWNRWRRWCLYGFRYYFIPYTNSLTQPWVNIPGIAQLDHQLSPVRPNGETAPWLIPYPRPVVRYWPFRPYCCRWYWFRCLPWIQYRHFPPILHTAIVQAKPEHGGGFVDLHRLPEVPRDLRAPEGPPNRADGTTTQNVPDSFFDIFLDVGECRYRAVEERLSDLDGDGKGGNRHRRDERALPRTFDSIDEDDNPTLVRPPRG